MAKTTEATKSLRSSTRTERGAFAAGDKVEYQGKLAKVIEFGFLEQPRLPGEDAKISEGLVANLQLPADTEGGKPDTAYMVPASEIKSLKGDSKRQRALEMEWNPFFGDPKPLDPAKDGPAPVTRQKGAAPKASKTRSTDADGQPKKGVKGVDVPLSNPKGSRPPKDVAREFAATGKAVTTKEGDAPKASRKSGSKKSGK